MTTQLFFGRVYHASYTFVIGAENVTTTAGYYYLNSHSTDTSTGFLLHLQTKIRACTGTDQSAATVEYLTVSKRVKITLENAAALDLVPGSDSTLKGILGFSNDDYASATTFTAERSPKYTWQPGRSMSNFPLQAKASNFWVPKSHQTIGRSLDGIVYTVPMPTLYSAEIEYFCLAQSDVLTPVTGTIYEDFQQFFTDVILPGNYFTFFPDSTAMTSSDVLYCLLGKDGEEELGAFTQYESRHIKSYNSLFNLKIPLLKVV